MENSENLKRLEAVVEKMLGKLNDLQGENCALQAKIQDKEKELEVLEGKIDSMTLDQETIGTRVSSLISSIEDWEKMGSSADSDSALPPAPSTQEEKDHEASQEPQLFSLGENQ